MIKINVEQGSEAWFEHRLGRFTASKFSKLMSGMGTMGFKELISEIAAEIASGEIEESYTNADMERGIELEPFARKEYEDIFHCNVDEVGFCIPDETDPLHLWVGVSPDGMVENGGGIIEIKCPKKKTHWGYIRAGKLPNEYKWQVQGQLFVTGAGYCDFISYHPSLKPFIIRVRPNLDMHDELKTRIIEAIKLVKDELKFYAKYDCLEI